MNLNQIQNALASLSLEEVKQVKDWCSDIIFMKSGDIRSLLKVGQIITVDHKKTRGMQFKIEKLNNVKAKVVQIYPVTARKYTFTVPYSLIQIK